VLAYQFTKIVIFTVWVHLVRYIHLNDQFFELI
jgi:hypothetical protein